MIRREIQYAGPDCVGSHVLCLSNGAAIMTEPMMPKTFSMSFGHSSRLVRARRYFVESYLRRHDFVDVRSEVDKDSIVFSMAAMGQTYRLRVSEAWMVSSTHARVDERLDQLQAWNLLREYGAAYLDVTTTGQEVMSRSHSVPLR